MLTCGACGTVNYYVFCTECGIKLPDEEKPWHIFDPKVTESMRSPKIEQATKQAVMNMRRTTELSLAMYRALGADIDENYADQVKGAASIIDGMTSLRKISARKSIAAANALEALSWR